MSDIEPIVDVALQHIADYTQTCAIKPFSEHDTPTHYLPLAGLMDQFLVNAPSLEAKIDTIIDAVASDPELGEGMLRLDRPPTKAAKVFLGDAPTLLIHADALLKLQEKGVIAFDPESHIETLARDSVKRLSIAKRNQRNDPYNQLDLVPLEMRSLASDFPKPKERELSLDITTHAKRLEQRSAKGILGGIDSR